MNKQMVPYLLIFFFTMVFARLEIVLDVTPFFRVYSDGRVDRLRGKEIIPPSIDPNTNVQSKDTQYEPQYNLSVPQFLASEANIIAVSVRYRRATEHLVPCAFNDSWTALKWVESHPNGEGPEEWLNRHADFERVFFCGDSSGANIAHNMAMRHGLEKLEGVNVIGLVLSHPYFTTKRPLDGGRNTNDTNEIASKKKWLQLIYPSGNGLDDPLMNPTADPNLAKLGCGMVLDLVAGADSLRHQAKHYYDILRKSGWKGHMEIFESPGEYHSFHLRNPTTENVIALRKKIACFVNQV